MPRPGTMVESHPMGAQRKPAGRAGSLLLAGKLLLGVGLIIIVVLLISGFRRHDSAVGFNDKSAGHGWNGGNASPALSPFQQAKADTASLSAASVVNRIKVYGEMSAGSKVIKEFPRQDRYRMPTTFLVTNEGTAKDGSAWYQVLVPARPNGTKGWIRAADTQAAEITHSIKVSLADHRLDLFERGQLVKSYPVGVGKEGTRTPTGKFFFTTKVRPSDHNGMYGALAIGISAYSDTLTDWPGGGQVGIHGTNDDAGIGHDVSHGCIRMHNADIMAITNVCPLGTPVTVEQ